VRLYLASALQRLPVEQRWEIAAGLIKHGQDSSDHNIPTVLWYGVEPLVGADPERALELAAASKIEPIARFLVRRAAAEPRSHPALVHAIGAAGSAQQRAWMLEEFEKGLGDQRKLTMPPGWAELRERLGQDPSADVRQRAGALAAILGDPASFPAQRQRLADTKAEPEARRAALDALARGSDPQLCPLLLGLLDDPQLRGDALRALAACDEPGIAKAVLARWPTFSDTERRDALNLLSSRTVWAAQLVDALVSGQVARTEVGAFVVRKIENLGDAALAARMQDVWGRVKATPETKRKRIDELKARLGARSARRGRPAARPRGLLAHLPAVPHAVRARRQGRARADRREPPRPRVPALERRRSQRGRRQGLLDDARVAERRAARDRHPAQEHAFVDHAAHRERGRRDRQGRDRGLQGAGDLADARRPARRAARDGRARPGRLPAEQQAGAAPRDPANATASSTGAR
jgi:hypothetical protein